MLRFLKCKVLVIEWKIRYEKKFNKIKKSNLRLKWEIWSIVARHSPSALITRFSYKIHLKISFSGQYDIKQKCLNEKQILKACKISTHFFCLDMTKFLFKILLNYATALESNITTRKFSSWHTIFLT